MQNTANERGGVGKQKGPEHIRYESVQTQRQAQVLEQHRSPKKKSQHPITNPSYTETKDPTTTTPKLQLIAVINITAMKLSLSIISIILTSALAASIKRQNDVPMCEKGDFAEQSGPYSSRKQTDPYDSYAPPENRETLD